MHDMLRQLLSKTPCSVPCFLIMHDDDAPNSNGTARRRLYKNAASGTGPCTYRHEFNGTLEGLLWESSGGAEIIITSHMPDEEVDE